MTKFADFEREVEEEAQAEGPEAVQQLQDLRRHYRTARRPVQVYRVEWQVEGDPTSLYMTVEAPDLARAAMDADDMLQMRTFEDSPYYTQRTRRILGIEEADRPVLSCCALAARRPEPCVCTVMTDCPEHGTIHHGTHD